MSSEELSKEQRILRAMRKTLASVVKDATPQEGYSPLSEETIINIKECFALISMREKELADAMGIAQAKPYYTDDVQNSTVVNFVKSAPKDSEKH